MFSGICGAKFVLIEWQIFGLGKRCVFTREIVQLSQTLLEAPRGCTDLQVVCPLCSADFALPHRLSDALKTAHSAGSCHQLELVLSPAVL